MKVAILSDIHDNYNNLLKALEILKKEEIKEMIFCGDVCAPSVLKELLERFDGKIHLVFGNVDGDQAAMKKISEGNDKIKIYGSEGKFELNGKKIFFTHKSEDAEKAAKTGKYDLVCHGHSHQSREEKIGETLILNPGSTGGLFAQPTFIILDLESLTPHVVELSDFDF